MNEDRTAIEEFSGVARLFPLPGFVLFPHAVQPLHIFEQRYRDMTRDALSDDRLVAMAMLHDDAGSESNPPLQSIACLGRIVMEQRLPDGRYNLLLRGLARIRIIEELETATPYRLARVDVISDRVSSDIDELMALRTGLADLILPGIAAGPIRDHIQGLFKSEEPLGHVCDVLSFALPLPADAKQQLLERIDVVSRAKQLMEAFQTVAPLIPQKPLGSNLRFPPDFSVN